MFVTFMLSPAIEDAGPAAAEIMPALGCRGIMTVLPALALATVLSAASILQGLAGASVEDRARQLAVAGEPRSRGARAGRFGAALLLAAATGMAVARYL